MPVRTNGGDKIGWVNECSDIKPGGEKDGCPGSVSRYDTAPRRIRELERYWLKVDFPTPLDPHMTIRGEVDVAMVWYASRHEIGYRVRAIGFGQSKRMLNVGFGGCNAVL
jgi:hypothetical protein